MAAFHLRLAFLLLTVFGTASICRAQQPAGPERWEPQIKAIEEKAAKNAPSEHGVVFVGSSSIRMWDVARFFPGTPPLNHGFGGSEYVDAAYYVDRLILPFRPRTVVLYSGDNDLAKGKKPDEILRSLKQLVQRVHEVLPATRIVVIGVKPSISRWKLIESVRATNRMIADFVSTDQRLAYVDIDGPMLGDDGLPRKELFLKDGLHMTDAGYAIWTSLVEPYLVWGDSDPVVEPSMAWNQGDESTCCCRRCSRAARRASRFAYCDQ